MTDTQPLTGYLIGTDIGGTFTDLVLLEAGRRPRLFKAPTTPHDRSEGIINALELAAEAVQKPLGEFAAEIRYFAHGTTAATNALIERKGATTALLTTSGFADGMIRTTDPHGVEKLHHSAGRHPQDQWSPGGYVVELVAHDSH